MKDAQESLQTRLEKANMSMQCCHMLSIPCLFMLLVSVERYNANIFILRISMSVLAINWPWISLLSAISQHESVNTLLCQDAIGSSYGEVVHGAICQGVENVKGCHIPLVLAPCHRKRSSLKPINESINSVIYTMSFIPSSDSFAENKNLRKFNNHQSISVPSHLPSRESDKHSSPGDHDQGDPAKETHVESLHTSLVLWCQFCSWDTECWLPTAIRCYKCSFSRMNRKGMQPRWCCLLVCWTRIKFHASYYNWLVTCRQITHAYLQWKLWIKVPGRGSKGKLQRDDSLGSFSELQIDSKTSSIWRKDVGIQDSALTQGIYSIFRSCFKKKHHFHHLLIRILRSFDRVCSWSVNGELIQVSFSLDLGVLPQLFFIN